MPRHWFRPLNPKPHPLKRGEKVVCKVKSKRAGGGKWAITACDEQPDPAAVLLLDDDDLERDD